MRRNHNLKTCPVCGEEYHPAPAGCVKKRYCSDRCRREARRRHRAAGGKS